MPSWRRCCAENWHDVTSTPRRSFVALYVLSGCLSLGYGFIFTMLRELADAFGFSDAAVGAIAASGFLAGFVAQSTLSRFADRGHGQLMLRAGMVSVISGALWMCVATEIWQFVAARILVGLGSGVANPVLRRVVIMRDPEHIGHNMGRLMSADMTGFVIGPALTGLLVEFGLRVPFVVLAVLYACVIPAALSIESPPPLEGSGGSANRRLLAQPEIVGTLAVGAAFFAVVGLWEATWALLLGDLGAETWFVGLTASLFTSPMIILAPIGGRSAQRRGPLRVATVSTLIAAACMVVYGIVGEFRPDPLPDDPPVHIAALAILFVVSVVHAVADSFTMPANQVAMARAAPPGDIAAAQGLFSACGLLTSFVVAAGGAASYDTLGPLPTFTAIAAVMVVLVVVARRRAPGLIDPGPITAAEPARAGVSEAAARGEGPASS